MIVSYHAHKMILLMQRSIKPDGPKTTVVKKGGFFKEEPNYLKQRQEWITQLG
jgi:hypothetical protein